MQLQGIVFIQLQGNDIFVNCKKYIYSKDIYLFTKSIVIRGNYTLSRNHIHFKELISSFYEIYPRSMKRHIHSGTLYPLKDIY